MANVQKMTAGEIFKAIGATVEMKPKAVQAVVYAFSDLAAAMLKKGGELRIPHIGRLSVKDIPKKTYPAGDYANMFKKDKEGKPLMEYKEKRVRPAKKKIKFLIASQIKSQVVAKVTAKK